jgi:hypothetical protein
VALTRARFGLVVLGNPKVRESDTERGGLREEVAEES